MNEYDLGQFLTNDEREVIAAKRQQVIAKTLLTHARLLYQLGVPAETIQPSVDSMRDQLESQPNKEIKKIRRALLEAASKLPDLPTPDIVEAVAFEQMPATEQESEDVSDPESQLTELVSVGLELAPDVQEEPEEIDETKPKKLPPQLNHLFGRVLTFEQRDAIMTLSAGQKIALENAVHKIIAEHGHHGQKNIALAHMQKLRMLLDGKNAEQIARELSISPSNVSSPFRNSLRQLMFQNKHEIAQTYADILAMDPDAPVAEFALESTVTEAPVKVKSEKIVRPEGLSVHIDNLFLNTLRFDQRAAIPGFTRGQRAELSSLLDKILTTNYPDQRMKDIQMSRFEKMMNGVPVKEIADEEGNVHFFAITQQFRKSLPSVLKPHKEEISDEFDKIINLSKDEHDSDTQSVDDPTEISQLTIDTPNELAAAEVETDFVKQEPLTDKMYEVFRTDDEHIRKGVEDLFSVNNGVISSSERSVEAARYLGSLISAKNISIDMAIANPGPRGVVNRLLKGVDTPEGTKHYTLSEILEETPQELRTSKREAVEKALEKIAKQLGGVEPAKQDILENRISSIRAEFEKILPNTEGEIIDQIISMVRDKPVVSTIELNKALRDLYREAKKSENDLPDFGLIILHGFALPGPTGNPMSLTEIKNSLVRRDPENKLAYENGFVSHKLLETLEKLIEMAGL